MGKLLAGAEQRSLAFIFMWVKAHTQMKNKQKQNVIEWPENEVSF